MAGIRDLHSGKIYIGPEMPKVDQSKETLDGDSEFDGTLAAVGPVFLGEHSNIAMGHVNIGTGLDIQKFKPGIKGCALSVEGDVDIIGSGNGDNSPNAVRIDGDLYVTGAIDGGNKGRLASRFGTADALGKSFDIKHPTKDGYRLRYACIEGPEVAIYHRGRLQSGTEINLPDHWKNMVYEDSITVQITPIGKQEDIYVSSFNSEKVVLESDSDIDCFYMIVGERNDINPLIVEYEGETWEDYPDPNTRLDPSDKDRNIKDPNYDTGQNTKTIV
tara:strand:- start:1287 stop:2108 length:822 start_codon:yes stop_codon:yes gene_type:complete